MHKLYITLTLICFLLEGCISMRQVSIPPTETMMWTHPAPTLTFTPTLRPTSTLAATATQPSAAPEPEGCLKPPDDYTRVEVNGEALNQRTLAMLAQAQELYGGEIQLTGFAITQGSYSTSVSASFGTHSGGGAVDLSVLSRETYTVLWDDIEPLIHALRTAGFAAWLREYGELHEGSPIHIHAIAIGDRELSTEAANQLTGEAGYFRGFSGLPVALYGAPTADRYGGPIVCGWMPHLGYIEMR
jgi:hypothetical protein